MSTWWDANALGRPSELPTLTVYSFLWYVMQFFKIPNGTIQLLLESISFIVSGLAMFYFISILIGKKPLPSLVGSIFYMANVSVIFSVLSAGMNWMRAFLPLILALFVRLIQKQVSGEPAKHSLVCFMLVFSISLSFLTVNAALLVISFFCLGLTALYVALVEKKKIKVLLGSIKVLAFSIMASLWWIIPFALLALQNVGSVVEGANVWNWAWSHSRASILNILWLNAYWGWRPEYYPFIGYYSNPGVILTTFVPIIIVAFGLLFSQRKRILRYYFTGIILVAMFLAKGLHPPFEQLNAFLYQHIPGFSVLFRESVSKFNFMITFFLAPVLACGVNSVLTNVEVHLPSKRPLLKKAVSFSVVAVLILTIMVSSAPIFLGLVAETKTEQLPSPSYVSVPEYWFKLGDYFSNDTDDFRVLVTPDDDFYQMPYKWGYYGADALPLRFTSKPVLYHTSGYFQSPADDILNILYQALEDGDILTFNNLLTAMNVKYILLRNDIWWNFTWPGRHITNPEIIKKHLANNPEFEFAQSIGELDVYRYKNWEPLHFYVPTRIFVTDSSPRLLHLLSRYIDLKNDVVLFVEKQESVLTEMLLHVVSHFVHVISVKDFNQTQNEFFKELEIYSSGVYKVFVASNRSLTVCIDGNFLNVSKSNGSFMTSDVYLERGIHKIKMKDLLEKKLLSLESWKNATIENQFGAVYTLEIEQDILKATLYNSTWGWKTLSSPLVEARKDEKCTFYFEVRGNNVHQLHAKVLEYDENLNLVEVRYIMFLFEGNFEWIPVNATYAPLRSETRYVRLQLWHGHETDKPLPNIIWLRNTRIIIDRTAGFDGLLLFQNSSLSEQLKTEKSKVQLNYVKLSPYEYRVHISTEKPFLLVFSESHNPLWKVMEGNQSWYEVPFRATLPSYHLPANGFGNMWYINKTGNFDITIFYLPQAYFHYAFFASGLFFGFIILPDVTKYLRARGKKDQK